MGELLLQQLHLRVDDQGANFATTASFSTTWKTPNVTISMSNLNGNQFLETYASTAYTVNQTNMSSSANYTHTVSASGGSLSSTTGSGTFTFTTPIHKDNNTGGRSVAVSTEFRRPPGVATTTYAVTDGASDTSINANFTLSFSLDLYYFYSITTHKGRCGCGRSIRVCSK